MTIIMSYRNILNHDIVYRILTFLFRLELEINHTTLYFMSTLKPSYTAIVMCFQAKKKNSLVHGV